MKRSYFPWALAALTVALAQGAQAQKVTSEWVEDITLTNTPSVVTVNIKDVSGGNSLNGVNVQPTTNSLTFPVKSTVKCAKDSAGYAWSKVGFGAFNPTFLDQGVVHQEDNPNAGHSTWVQGNWLTEAAAVHQYQVAVADLKNPAKPERQLDPVAEFQAAMASFVEQGGTELDYLRKNRTVDVQRHISVFGACWEKWKQGGGVGTDKGYASYTKPVTIRIQYQGNPNLTNINAQLGQMGGGGFQAGYNPLTITQGLILPHAPNYVGACPADLKFRVKLQGGGEGQVRYHITRNGATVYSSPTLDFANGKLEHEFVYPVKYEGKFSLNKKVDHNFTLHLRLKDKDMASFPVHSQNYGSRNWSHTCTPQVNVGVGGVGPGGAQIQQQQPGPSLPGNLNLQAVPANQAPAAPAKKVQPAAPAAPAQSAPAQLAPAPGPRSIPARKVEDEEPPARAGSR